MKRFLTFTFVLFLIFTFTSCKKEYTYKFLNEDGTILLEVKAAAGSKIYEPAIPTKEKTPEFSYEFIGWDKEIGTLTSNITFTAKFKEVKNKYLIKFVNFDDTLLKEEYVEYGKVPTLPDTPIKPSTKEEDFKFVGFDKEVVSVTQDATYKAIFSSSKAKYLVRFVNDDDTLIKEEYLEYGTLPTTPIPSKEKNAEYTYEFIGFDKEVKEVTSDVTYKACYKATKNKYLVKFVNFDDTLLKEEYVEYGTVPTLPDTPTKPSTVDKAYTFKGYDKEVKEVTTDVTYKAEFTEEVRKYKITFVDDEDKVIDEIDVEYGTKPIAPTAPQKPGNQAYTYIFVSWDKEITEVTGDATYKSVYQKVKKMYKCRFLDEDGTLIQEFDCPYGEMPRYPNVQDKEDDNFFYKYIGWDKEVESVTADVTYTAVFEKTLKEKKFKSLEGKKLSILGDSISTFYSSNSSMNSYYSEVGKFYYPTYCPDVKTVDKTWWGQLLTNTKMVLGINNSWSGSTAVGTNEQAGCSDARLNTLVENGNPDIVILYLGTNDVCAGISVSEFIKAYETILNKIYNLCAPQIYVCTLGFSAYTGMQYKDSTRIEYNKAIRDFALKHNLGVIPLDEYVQSDNYKLYLSDNLHYKYKGTTLLSQIMEKSLCEYNNIPYDKTVDVEHPIPEPVGHVKIGSYNAGVWTPDVYQKNALLYDYATLDKGSAFTYYYLVKITKVGDNYKVTGKKDVNIKEDFSACDYYILLNVELPSTKFFNEVNVGDMLKLTGDITSGNCEFTLITE